MATKPTEAEVQAAWTALKEEDLQVLVSGAGLDRATLIEAGLVRESYRTNRSGEIKFNGRRTPLGRAVAAYGKGVLCPGNGGSSADE